MSKISQYSLRTLVSGDEFVVAVGGRNYRVLFDNMLPRGHISGLTLSNNTTDPTNDIDIAAGEAKDTANSVLLKLSSGLTKRLDATWVAGTGQGMRTSSVAISNTTWHIFLMRVGGVDDIGADTSVTGANLVIDHSATNLRRIGSIRRVSNAIGLFTQNGDEFLHSVPVRDVNNAATSTVGALQTLSVPLGIKVGAMFTGHANRAAAGNYVLFSSPDQANTAPTDSAFNIVLNATITSMDTQFREMRTNTSAQVRQRSDHATITFYVITHGWIDTRGRFD